MALSERFRGFAGKRRVALPVAVVAVLCVLGLVVHVAVPGSGRLYRGMVLFITGVTGVDRLFTDVRGEARGGDSDCGLPGNQGLEAAYTAVAITDADLVAMCERGDVLGLAQAVLRERSARGQYAWVYEENRDLRAVLGMHRRTQWRRRCYRVVGRNAMAGWWSQVIIDGGYLEDVDEGDVVSSFGGLVGVVEESHRNRAVVLLLTSPRCRVTCRCWPSGSVGVLNGGVPAPAQASANELELLLPEPVVPLDVDPNCAPGVGESVFTWGLGDGFPEGFKIGDVVAAPRARGVSGHMATVELAADIASLSVVFVVKRGDEK